jgi:hypothetical protein
MRGNVVTGPPRFLYGAALVLLALALGSGLLNWRGGPDVTLAHAPHPGLDFSMNIRGTNCGTGAGQTTDCALFAGNLFTLEVRLDNLPDGIPTYTGFDLDVRYSGVASHDNPSAAKWPDCLIFASDVDPGVSVLWGCTSAPSSTSYTGPIGTLDFTCSSTGAINLVHGVNNTNLSAEDPFHESHAEGQGTVESINVSCEHNSALGGVAAYPNLPSGRSAGELAGGALAVAIVALGLSGAAYVARRRRSN